MGSLCGVREQIYKCHSTAELVNLGLRWKDMTASELAWLLNEDWLLVAMANDIVDELRDRMRGRG